MPPSTVQPFQHSAATGYLRRCFLRSIASAIDTAVRTSARSNSERDGNSSTVRLSNLTQPRARTGVVASDIHHKICEARALTIKVEIRFHHHHHLYCLLDGYGRCLHQGLDHPSGGLAKYTILLHMGGTLMAQL